jgi:hypothetical protein
MLGSGGSAPSPKHDIRLGDVVVSSPADRTGGVIHYEFGKTIRNQKLERTGRGVGGGGGAECAACDIAHGIEHGWSAP